MNPFVVAAVLVVLAFLFVLWTVNQMLHSACPSCYREDGSHQMVMPVIPGIRSFCPNCGELHAPADLIKIKPGAQDEH